MNPQQQPPKNNPNGGNFFNRNPLLLFALFSLIVIVTFKGIVGEFSTTDESSSFQTTSTKRVDYFELKEMIRSGTIHKVMIGETTLKGNSSNGTTYISDRVHPDPSLVTLMDEKKVRYGAFSEKNWLTDLLFGWVLPVFIFFGIWMLLAGRMQKNLGGSMLNGMGFGKKYVASEKPKTTFADVAGNEEAKDEVKEIVDFLKDPERYIRLGAKIPKGVLLVGPPGTGKTLLAKAVAGEAGVPFFSVTGSSFIEMFVGVGAARVRELFESAKKDAPAIVFIDELDALGKSRAAGGFGGNDEREQTLNQLLAEMDGFGTEAPIIILAATNRPEILDPALLRPGRFDRQVLVDKPDFKGRVEILNVHIKNIKYGNDVDIEDLARLTAGLAGADLANIINEAALLAGRASKTEVTQKDMKEAVERAIAGLEKKSRRINKKEKKIVAYHESGHALIAQTTKGAKKVNKVSIIPRGLAALGYTLNTPEENKYLMQKHELLAEVDVLLGGRAAEEVFLHEISTGAGNDLERATDILKSMAMLYGMSHVTGLMVLEKSRNSFLGGGIGQTREFSEETAQKVDHYIQDLLEERYNAVKERLIVYKEAIEVMVQELQEIEVLNGERVKMIIHDYEKENNLPTLLENEPDEELIVPKNIVISIEQSADEPNT